MWQRNKREGREAPGGKAGNFGMCFVFSVFLAVEIRNFFNLKSVF